MSNYPVGRRPRTADPHAQLRIAALTAVIVGVVLLAAAAFVLSYSGIHQVALQAGVSPRLARLYPVIFDAMLVIAGAAAMALRGAGWWPRFYAWACLIVLLAAVATGDAVHATGTALPQTASRAAVAITPWVLLLLAFGLLLEMLRHFRKARASVAARQAARASGEARGPRGENGAAAGRTAVTWAATAGAASAAEGRPLPPPRTSLDTLLGPRAAQEAAAGAAGETSAADTGIGDDTGVRSDPVAYGEETGYVHPDSYQEEGEYSPHGDSGGPGIYGAGYPGQDQPADASGQGGSAAGHGPATEAATTGTATAPETGTAPVGPTARTDTAAATGTVAVTGAGAATGTGGEGTEGRAATGGGEKEPAANSAPPDTQTQAAPNGAPPAEPAPAAAGTEATAGGEAAAAETPALERMRSTPSRPEE